MDTNKKTMLENLYNRLTMLFSDTVVTEDEEGKEVKVQTEDGNITSGDMVTTEVKEGTVVLPEEDKTLTVDGDGLVTDVAKIPTEEVETEMEDVSTKPDEADNKIISELTTKVTELGNMLKEVLDLIASQNADIEMVKEQPVSEKFSAVVTESATEIRKNKIKAIQEYYRNK